MISYIWIGKYQSTWYSYLFGWDFFDNVVRVCYNPCMAWHCSVLYCISHGSRRLLIYSVFRGILSLSLNFVSATSPILSLFLFVLYYWRFWASVRATPERRCYIRLPRVVYILVAPMSDCFPRLDLRRDRNLTVEAWTAITNVMLSIAHSSGSWCWSFCNNVLYWTRYS